MKQTILIGLVLGVAVIRVVASAPDANAEEKRESRQAAEVVVKTYRTSDLPVYTSEKRWKPELLMSLIQSTVLPKSWEAKGGVSTMAPYPQNQSIVISTTTRGHDRIVKLLEGLRG